MGLNKVQQTFIVVQNRKIWREKKKTKQNNGSLFFTSWLIRKEELLLNSKYAKGFSSYFKQCYFAF